jgi:hypothetical protein
MSPTAEMARLPPGRGVAGPQLHPIKALHRHNGYITFSIMGDDDEGMTGRFAIRADALDRWFPEFTSALTRNSFVSINASYCLADRKSRAEYGVPLHRSDSLRYLCACYCDIDCYKRGLDPLQVRAELERMWESGELPEASMVVDSGRGMWLLYLLHDPTNPDKAHLGAYSDNPSDHLQLYVRINKALHMKLSHLGADPIGDGARLIRSPGSFRNDTEEFVKWRIHGNSDRAISYTLKELASHLGLTLSARLRQERNALDGTRAPRGKQRNGWVKTNENRLAVILTIMDLRGGGFREGCRNHAAFIYAMALKSNNVDMGQAKTALLEMGKRCSPSLSNGECRLALKSGYNTRKRKLSYKTVADLLDVSPAEAECISQMLYGTSPAGDRRFFPAAQRFGAMMPITNPSGDPTRRTKKLILDEAIDGVLSATGHVPSIRVMQCELLKGGCQVGVGTLQRRYKALGLVSKAAETLAVNRENAAEESQAISLLF